MRPEKLVRMANQIASFFAHEGPERATASIADHLRKFWDPRMRGQIVAALVGVCDAADILRALSSRAGPRSP